MWLHLRRREDVTRDGNNRDSIGQRFVICITFRKLGGENSSVYYSPLFVIVLYVKIFNSRYLLLAELGRRTPLFYKSYIFPL